MSGVWMAGCSISMAPASDDSPVLTSVSISGSSKERANWSLKMTIVKYELVSQKISLCHKQAIFSCAVNRDKDLLFHLSHDRPLSHRGVLNLIEKFLTSSIMKVVDFTNLFKIVNNAG